MSKMKRNKSHHSNNNRKKQNNSQSENKPFAQKQKVFQFNKTQYENFAAEQQRQQAIADLKARETICPKCNQPIKDVASAINDRITGKPAHFECVMSEVSKNERLGENEKIAYIGQGRFGVLYYDNPRDVRKFTIKRIIEVEDRESRSEWREEIAGLYSQVQ